jgi:hypothetical protein
MGSIIFLPGWKGLRAFNFENSTIPLYIKIKNLYIKNDGATPNKALPGL